jgi:hypothetical protein
MIFFVNTWMISWFITSMMSSFFQRTWKTMNDMFDLFWTSSRKLDSMPSWKNVNFIKLKQNSLVTSYLKMASAWIFARFKPLSIGLLEFLFAIFNVFLDSLTSQCFIAHYSTIVTIFTQLTWKDQPFS